MTACSGCSRRAGLTLIEVVAAIAILGTLLVGIVLASARHTRQIADTRQIDTIVRAADDLLAQWWVDPDEIPIGQSGVIETSPSLAWRTYLVANSDVEDLGARVLRVEVGPPGKVGAALGPNDKTIVTVDLVLPQEEKSSDESDAGDSGEGGGDA